MKSQPRGVLTLDVKITLACIAVVFVFAFIPGFGVCAALASFVAVTAALSKRIGWFASAVAALLAVFSIVQLASSMSYLQTTVSVGLIIWIALLVTTILGAWATRNGLAPISRGGVVAAAIAGAPALLTWLALLVSGAFTGARLGWMLINDAQFNTVMVRRMIELNGSDPDVADVPSLAQQLMAAISSTMHLTLSVPGGSFVTLLSIEASVVAGLWMLCGPVFGLIAFRELKSMQFGWRLLATFLAGSFPFCWFLLGSSIGYGFFNVPIALLAISMTWVIWRFSNEGGGARITQPALLWLCVLMLLGAWIPLAVMPVAFAIAATFTALRSQRSELGKLWPLIAAFVIVCGYAAAVVVPSYLKFGKSLAANGAIVNFGPFAFALVVCLGALAATLAATKWLVSSSVSTGLMLLIGAASVGLAGLYLSARAWTYYPAKFAWISAFFIVFVTLVTLLEYIQRSGPVNRSLRFVASVAVAGVVASTMAMTVSPGAATGGWFPFIGIARTSTEADSAVLPIADVLGRKTIRIVGEQNRLVDGLVNGWALQWDAQTSRDPIRAFAYEDVTPENVCAIAETWGGGVTVEQAGAYAGELLSACNAVEAAR